MKRSFYKLTACSVLIATVLTGCRGGQSVISPLAGSSASILPDERQPSAFRAHYRGFIKPLGNCPFSSAFRGVGSASVPGMNRELIEFFEVRNKYCYPDGEFISLRIVGHPRDQLFFSFDLYPCYSPVHFTVLGGRGRFRHATGSGTATFHCNYPKYSDKWVGTITF